MDYLRSRGERFYVAVNKVIRAGNVHVIGE